MIIRPSQILREAFFQQGIAQRNKELPWWCVRVQMPDGVGTNDNIIAVVDRDDVSIDRYISDGNYALDPHVLIVVRGVGLVNTYEKVRQITSFMDPLSEYPIVFPAVPSVSEEVQYMLRGTKRTTNVTFSGSDGTGRRYVFTIDYDLLLE